MSDIEHKKALLRDEIRALRKAVPWAITMAASETIKKTVSSTPEYQNARWIALYASLPEELPLRVLFEEAIENERGIVFPRCCEDGTLDFVPVTRWADLLPGSRGVLEPPADAAAVALNAEDLVIVPGVVFGAGGHRLGLGQGYYDRTFPPESLGVPTLFGVGYEFQVVDHVPHTTHDRAVDAVITEDRMRTMKASPSQ